MAVSKRQEKLAGFLREVSNWNWAEFCKAEKDPTYTTNEAIIFALVRACAMQKMDAIKMAINRLDGKLKTPIKIEYPKVFFLYPNAIPLPEGEVINDHGRLEAPETDGEVVTGEVIQAPPQPEPEPEPQPDLPSMSFRETVALMSDHARDVPEQIVYVAEQTQQWLLKKAPEPEGIPRVKAVVAAHLLVMAQGRSMDAIGEVFDAIDGKLVETIQILGDDLYITNYSNVAPAGAVPNEKGILQMEATASQKMWAEKLSKDK